MALVRTYPYYSASTSRIEVNNRRYSIVRSNRNGHVSVFESITDGCTMCIYCAARRNNTMDGA